MYNLHAVMNPETFDEVLSNVGCYECKPLELGKRTNFYIRVNTRKLDKELYIK